MTGVDLDARERLAAAMETITGPYRRLTDLLVDTLMPVVDRIASERAAAELEKAADAIHGVHRDLGKRADLPTIADQLRVRAAALRAATTEDPS